MFNIDHTSPKVKVGTATGQTQKSTVTGNLNLRLLPTVFPIKVHLMPGFRHTLVEVGPLCDTACTVIFAREAVIVQDKQGTPVLTGWREDTGSRLCRIDLQPG